MTAGRRPRIPSQRQIERDLWVWLGGYLHASEPDELGIGEGDHDAWSAAEWKRYDAACAKIQRICYTHAGPAVVS